MASIFRKKVKYNDKISIKQNQQNNYFDKKTGPNVAVCIILASATSQTARQLGKKSNNADFN